MTKNNNLIPTNKAPIETVYELKDYEAKKSPLSLAAKSKVINKSGSNYISKKEGYGPMPIEPVYYKTDGYGNTEIGCGQRLQTIHYDAFSVILKAEWGVDHQYFFGIPLTETPKRSIDPFSSEARTFIDSVLTNYHNMSGIWQSGYMRIGIKLTSASQAEELLRHFANGNLKVRGRGNVHHRGAENVIINTVRTALSDWESGRIVNINRRF